ncbi:MAG TPA: hypothetical protein VJ370_07760 [Streptosporangiaceae bacterium]|nr:hypothetical protein [Streptosporangiaceae bacterium]
MGAFGGYERGWDQVSARLDWAAAGIKATDRAAENIVAVVGDNLAYTVDLERMTRHAGDDPTPRTLRCTQAYRRENGEWKVILRHADTAAVIRNLRLVRAGQAGLAARPRRHVPEGAVRPGAGAQHRSGS